MHRSRHAVIIGQSARVRLRRQQTILRRNIVVTGQAQQQASSSHKLLMTSAGNVQPANNTRGSAIAEEPRDAIRQLKYYGRFLTELLTRSSANPEEPCEHTVS